MQLVNIIVMVGVVEELKKHSVDEISRLVESMCIRIYVEDDVRVRNSQNNVKAFYGAPDLVTATFVQRNYRAEKSTFFLSVW